MGSLGGWRGTVTVRSSLGSNETAGGSPEDQARQSPSTSNSKPSTILPLLRSVIGNAASAPASTVIASGDIAAATAAGVGESIVTAGPSRPLEELDLVDLHETGSRGGDDQIEAGHLGRLAAVALEAAVAR